MRKLALSLTFLVFLFLSAASYATSTIGSASISALAVTGLGSGNVTPISINVTQGSGGVSILGPTTITNDTIQSAKQAASDASAYLGLKESNYNFTYFINYSSISGPSGGLALSLLAVSALTHTPLLTDFAVTGTIGTDGTVGEIGGIDEKASAAKAAGKSFVIVPMAANGTFENQLYYIVQQSLGLPLVQASSLAQALPYAYGTASPKPMSYNVLANYHLSQVQNFTPSCAGCNLSEFANLAYSTVNLTRKEANLIRGNYTTLKGQYLAMSNNYSTVISKGYMYTGADMAFRQFISEYLFANSNFSPRAVNSLVNNVTAYCNSLTPPLMTSSNYEYVTGGELRQTWGQITINNTKSIVSSAQTADDLAQAITDAGNAYAWCFAASSMYQGAAISNATIVNVSKSAVQAIYTSVTNAQNYPGLYAQAALIDYKSGLYTAALYNSEYAMAFDNTSSPLLTRQQLLNITKSNIANATNGGVWPYEFAAQSQFYLSQAALESSNATSYSDVNSAYQVSQLAKSLKSANGMLSSSFVAVFGGYPYVNSTAITSIQDQISQIYQLLFVMVGLMFVIFVILLLLLLRREPQPMQAARRGRRAAQGP